MMMNLVPLKEWFLEEGRDLPWRKSKTPYRVWISEVMLQQTQASVAAAYFERWMQKFPTLAVLARASQEEVIKAWEGLGYYSRARNVHAAAIAIKDLHEGELPADPEKLASLKGFGPYTVGAVLSFAFGKRAAAVDGNVVRVLSRLMASEVDAANRKFYHDLAQQLLPQEDAPQVMEGLIELGALICQKRPKCRQCPLQDQCKAYSQGIAGELPRKKKRATITSLLRDVAIIFCEGMVLLRQEKEGRIMGGLYEFPFVERGRGFSFDLSLEKVGELPCVKHSFTRYRATLFPQVFRTQAQREVENHNWVPWSQVDALPFSSGHRRIWIRLKDENFTH